MPGITRKNRGRKSTKARSEYRLSARDRRQSILAGALPLFARKGFHSTTTRELSAGLKVSEALLFKYFPTKDDLMHAIEDVVRQEMDEIFKVVLGWPVSSESLALAVAFNFLVLTQGHGVKGDKTALDRLVVFSLLEDGRFFRKTTKDNLPPYFDFLEKCYAEGVRNGEITKIEGSRVNGFWLCHHIAGFLALTKGSKAIDYEGDENAIPQEALMFCLRGLGFNSKAIQKYSKPEALAPLLAQRD